MNRRDQRTALIVAVVAAAGIAGHHGHPTHHHHGGGNARIGSPAGFARVILREEHIAPTSCRVAALVSWENAEGGNWHNAAAHNPLNTTYDNNGRWEHTPLIAASINSVGVRAYNNWKTGIRATVATLAFYPQIIGELRNGTPQSVAYTVAASTWGTQPYEANC